MLSYQHIYHAGGKLDVHKHAVLSIILDIMAKKDKPMSYLETHAGRGMYDLSCKEAQKTSEYKHGIDVLLKNNTLPSDHPYIKAITDLREIYGPDSYPGSPSFAHYHLRDTDKLHFMEMHPQEVKHLKECMHFPNVKVRDSDGYDSTLALSPPFPRRGLVLIDPSYEVKKEYEYLADFVQVLHQKWSQAVIVIWYPMLKKAFFKTLLERLNASQYSDVTRSEIIFQDPSTTEGLYGSGLFIINSPFTSQPLIQDLEDKLKSIFVK